MTQIVKNQPEMQETWVRTLGWEDPLEKEMATHSSILAWENLMDRGAWWAAVHGFTKSRAQLSDLQYQTSPRTQQGHRTLFSPVL